MASWILLIVLAYLCGSIPFGLLIAGARGIDIRRHGSGNIGSTNVGRVLGRTLGLACFALDLLKGFVPTFGAGVIKGLIPLTLVPQPISTRAAWLWLAVMAAAVLGHVFSPWLRFRGGKGVATSLGAMLGVFPYLTFPALGALAIWLMVAWIRRYVSLASCSAAVGLPLLVLAWGTLATLLVRVPKNALVPPGFWPFVIITAALAALVVLKHRANIQRLLAGTENRMGAR